MYVPSFNPLTRKLRHSRNKELFFLKYLVKVGIIDRNDDVFIFELEIYLCIIEI